MLPSHFVAFRRISVAFFRISVAFCRISVAFFCIFRIFVSSFAGLYRIYHMPLRAFSRGPTVAFFAFFRRTCPALRGMPGAARKKRRAKNEKMKIPLFLVFRFWFFILGFSFACTPHHVPEYT